MVKYVWEAAQEFISSWPKSNVWVSILTRSYDISIDVCVSAVFTGAPEVEGSKEVSNIVCV